MYWRSEAAYCLYKQDRTLLRSFSKLLLDYTVSRLNLTREFYCRLLAVEYVIDQSCVAAGADHVEGCCTRKRNDSCG